MSINSLQKMAFHVPKGGFLARKTWPFVWQKTTFGEIGYIKVKNRKVKTWFSLQFNQNNVTLPDIYNIFVITRMKEFVISEVKAETAVLVGLITPQQDEAKTK